MTRALRHPLVWTWLLTLMLFSALVANAHCQDAAPASAQAPTVQILERVIPRECILSVQFEDVTKCHIEKITLTPNSECRGPIDEPLQCSKFGITLNKECHYKVTRRADCEMTNVKRVPAKTGDTQ